MRTRVPDRCVQTEDGPHIRTATHPPSHQNHGSHGTHECAFPLSGRSIRLCRENPGLVGHSLQPFPVSRWSNAVKTEKRETFVGGSKINNINKTNNHTPPIHYVYIYVGKPIHDSFGSFVLFVTSGLIFGSLDSIRKALPWP